MKVRKKIFLLIPIFAFVFMFSIFFGSKKYNANADTTQNDIYNVLSSSTIQYSNVPLSIQSFVLKQNILKGLNYTGSINAGLNYIYSNNALSYTANSTLIYWGIGLNDFFIDKNNISDFLSFDIFSNCPFSISIIADVSYELYNYNFNYRNISTFNYNLNEYFTQNHNSFNFINDYIYGFLFSEIGGYGHNYDKITYKWLQNNEITTITKDIDYILIKNMYISIIFDYEYLLDKNNFTFTIRPNNFTFIPQLSTALTLQDYTLYYGSFIYNSGFSAGETAGYDSGFSAGETAGYDIGFSAGETAGYDSGFSAGETAGYSNKGFLANSIDNLNALFSVNIFGDLTVGNFIFICFSILAFFFLLKFIIR